MLDDGPREGIEQMESPRAVLLSLDEPPGGVMLKGERKMEKGVFGKAEVTVVDVRVEEFYRSKKDWERLRDGGPPRRADRAEVSGVGRGVEVGGDKV